MSIDVNYLLEIASSHGFILNNSMAKKFKIYAETLIEWNEKINLTAITQPKEIVIKHFLDSILLLDAVDVVKNSSLIDVGTGAGFPSIPCKIVRDDINITLLDSLNKRINFLKEVATKIEINSDFIHSRAEDLGKNPKYREKFDFATARAVANLAILAEYCLPFVKVGGTFIALKGSDVAQEIKDTETSIVKLGGKISDIKRYTLPDGSERNIVLIKKISQTSPKYPRNSAQIKKSSI